MNWLKLRASSLKLSFILNNQFSKIAEHRLFKRFIIFTILLAAVVVGIQTYKEFAQKHSFLLSLFDGFILLVFIVEAGIKILAEGKKPKNYFKNPWNVFDFLIVFACLLEPILDLGGEFLPVLRLARILRVLRLVTAIPKLQLLVTCLLKSLPSMFYVSILLFLLFYVYGTLAVFFYGENDPIHFRNLQSSILTLFRVVTLEDWTDVMYINMYGSDSYGYSDTDILKWTPNPSASPLGAAIFFVSFVLIGTMIVLNLVIGVIMNSMDESNKEMAIQHELDRRKENPEAIRDGLHDLHIKVEDLSKEMSVIKKMIEDQNQKKS